MELCCLRNPKKCKYKHIYLFRNYKKHIKTMHQVYKDRKPPKDNLTLRKKEKKTKGRDRILSDDHLDFQSDKIMKMQKNQSAKHIDLRCKYNI